MKERNISATYIEYYEVFLVKGDLVPFANQYIVQNSLCG